MWRSLWTLVLVWATANVAAAQQPKAEDPFGGPVAAEGSGALIELEVTIVQWRKKAEESGGKGAQQSFDNVDVAALEKSGELRVIERIRLTTLDQKQAYFQRGERVPMIAGAMARNGFPTQRSVNYQQVGTMVTATPKQQGGKLVVDIKIERSCVSDDDGPVIAEVEGGDKVRASAIVSGQVQTTVSVADGKTVVVGGLIRGREGTAEGETVLLSAKQVK